MLETEPQNRQSESSESSGSAGQAQTPGPEGSHRRGLLRRGRRVLSKPAEPPAFRSGEPESSGSGPATQADAGRSGAGRSGAGRSTSPGQAGPPGAVPVVPGVPAGGSEPASQGGGRQPSGAPQPVPAAAFQPPVLVFQPPELAGGSAESITSHADD